jgi:phytoene dehydrogenase-like protein
VPHGLYNYMAMHANASLAEPIDLVAASEQIKILQQIAVRGGGGYYVGGFGRVLDDIAASIRGSGGEIRTGTRVEQIDVVDGAVRGVSTADGRFEAPVVISNAGIQPTVMKLVGEEHFDGSYVDRVKGLQPGWGWASVRYFLGERVMKTGMYMVYGDDSWWNVERAERVRDGHVPDEVIMFITVPSNFDPQMAPPGKQCLVTGTICSPDPESGQAEMLYGKLDEMLESLYPEAWAAVERRECEGPREVSGHTRDHVLPGQGGECVGIGQIVGQCGTMKPSPQTPIRGLWLAGCDAGSACMGTHQAASSGMAVARLVARGADGRERAL